jgi:hypothetical protein
MHTYLDIIYPTNDARHNNRVRRKPSKKNRWCVYHDKSLPRELRPGELSQRDDCFRVGHRFSVFCACSDPIQSNQSIWPERDQGVDVFAHMLPVDPNIPLPPSPSVPVALSFPSPRRQTSRVGGEGGRGQSSRIHIIPHRAVLC